MPKSLYEEINELQYLRAQLRKREEDVAVRADARPLTADDERQMVELQSRADETYRAIGRFAAAPLPMERPGEYRRRLAAGLQEYSPRLAKTDIARMDERALAAIEPMIYADAVANFQSLGLRADEIKPIPIRENGHDVVVFIGGKNAHFIKTFSRDVRRAQMKSPDAYNAMSRDANLSRIEEVVRSAHRPIVQAPRASF